MYPRPPPRCLQTMCIIVSALLIENSIQCCVFPNIILCARTWVYEVDNPTEKIARCHIYIDDFDVPVTCTLSDVGDWLDI